MTYRDFEEARKNAQKLGDEDRLRLVRLILGELHNREIEKRVSGGTLTEDDVSAVLRREIKKRKEAIALFLKGGRPDLGAQEEKELRMLEAYVPPPPTPEAIEEAVERMKKEGHRDFPSLMQAVLKEFRGSADGGVVRSAVEKALGKH